MDLLKLLALAWAGLFVAGVASVVALCAACVLAARPDPEAELMDRKRRLIETWRAGK